MINEYGLPAPTLTDNGSGYTSRFTGGKNGSEHLLATAGIARKDGHRYHPQSQGKIEQFHQTLELWLSRQSSAGTLTLRHAGTLHHLGVGRGHGRTPALILVDATTVTVPNTGEILGTYLINPDNELLAQTERARPTAGLFLTINDVPNHLSTMSRLITTVREGGLEPPRPNTGTSTSS